MDRIRVGVMGACGKMGREVCKTVLEDPELELTAAYDVINTGYDIGILIGKQKTGILVESKLQNILDEKKVDVFVDFTNAQALLNNVPQLIKNGANVVIGTTGLKKDEIDNIDKLARKHEVGVFMAPNFAIGAVLMIQFAKEAAKYFPHIEIIEMHHDQKLDAPSGTALKTLEEIDKVRKNFKQSSVKEYEKINGARGGEYQGMKVHSVRLPGLIAHQEVILGGLGQTLTIRHDSLSRESFMPGVTLAVKKVISWKGLVSGLENILD